MSEIFVNSVYDAAKSVFSICVYLIFFSTINSYIAYFSQKIHFLKILLYITEITLGCKTSGNIYTISFLLGFSGLCVWSQIASLSKSFKINWKIFSLFRVFHGALSTFFTFILCKFLHLEIATISNNNVFVKQYTISGEKLAVSIIIMGILFIISLEGKKKSGKISDDLI